MALSRYRNNNKTNNTKVANDFLADDLFQPTDAAAEIDANTRRTNKVEDEEVTHQQESEDSQDPAPISPHHSTKLSPKSSQSPSQSPSHSRPLQPTVQKRNSHLTRMGPDVGLGTRSHPLSYAQAGHYMRPPRTSQDNSSPAHYYHGHNGTKDGSFYKADKDSSHVTGHMTSANHMVQTSPKQSTKVINTS